MSLTIANARIPGDRGLIGSIVNIHIDDSGVIRDIEFVGGTTAIQLRDTETDVIDAGGRFVIPGLWDAHTHFTNWALTLTQVNLEHLGSATETADFVGQWMRNNDGDMVGRDFRPSQWAVRPHYSILDAVTGDRAVALGRAQRVNPKSRPAVRRPPESREAGRFRQRRVEREPIFPMTAQAVGRVV